MVKINNKYLISIEPKKRFRPGEKALKEIRKFQRSTDLLINKLPFTRLVKEITFSFHHSLQWQGIALEAMQHAAEDYIVIANKCIVIILDNIPNFNDESVNQQQRFITLIDILYEKKIQMSVSSEFNLENFTSSRKLIEPYKRTISRLFELTSPNFNKN